MRARVRKQRAFRPSALQLEAICPVSSLATTLPLSSSDGLMVGNQPTRTDRTPPITAGHSISINLRIGAFGLPDRGEGRLIVSSVQSLPQVPMAAPSSIAPTFVVDANIAHNTITITPPIAASAGHSSGSASQPMGGGAGNVASTSVVAASGISTAEASAVATGMASNAVSTSSTASNPAQGAIRPLSKGPTNPSSPHGIALDGSGGSGGGTSGGSGGGNPPPNKPPIIQASGAGTGGSTIDGTGSVQDLIPVGTNMTCTASAPDGYVINSEAIVWNGGTGVDGYGLGDPLQPPPTQMGPTGAPYTNLMIYQFVVDSPARTYDIHVDVGYTNGAIGSADITFTSAKPAYNVTVDRAGTVGFAPSFVNGVPVSVTVGELVNPASGVDNSTRLKAVTGATNGIQFDGDFMWLQKINSTATIVEGPDAPGITHILTTNGLVIDDGFGLGPADLGQPTVEDYRTWPSDGIVRQGTFTDTPYIQDSSNGTAAWTRDKSISLNDSFKTYLMYRPNGGVWIALTEYDWNFQISLSNNQFPNGGGGWNGDPGTVQPNPTEVDVTGMDAFPSWSDQSFGHTYNPPFRG